MLWFRNWSSQVIGVCSSKSRKKHVPPTAKQKLMTKYPNKVYSLKKVYSLAFQTTLESKIREFQYKILNHIVFANEKLYRLGIVDSPNCAFCHDEVESIEHLLFFCTKSAEFWKHVLSWLKQIWFLENLMLTRILSWSITSCC